MTKPGCNLRFILSQSLHSFPRSKEMVSLEGVCQTKIWGYWSLAWVLYSNLHIIGPSTSMDDLGLGRWKGSHEQKCPYIVDFSSTQQPREAQGTVLSTCDKQEPPHVHSKHSTCIRGLHMTTWPKKNTRNPLVIFPTQTKVIDDKYDSQNQHIRYFLKKFLYCLKNASQPFSIQPRALAYPDNSTSQKVTKR
jgi:hypothetical protein